MRRLPSLCPRRRHLAACPLVGWLQFFAGRVVLIGHEVLRSKVRQGFITERVMTELNWLGPVMRGVVGRDLPASAPSSRRRGAWIAWAVTLLATFALFVLHTKLPAMLYFTPRQVTDDNRFYDGHHISLCTAAAHWLACGTLLLVFSHVLCPTKGIHADSR